MGLFLDVEGILGILGKGVKGRGEVFAATRWVFVRSRVAGLV